MQLLSEGQARAQVQQYLDSRAYWLFVPIGKEGTACLGEIESRYYSGEANTDFHLLLLPSLGPCPLQGVIFAKKARLSPRALSRHLRDYTAEQVTPQDLQERDVCALSGDPGEALAFLHALDAWLSEKTSPRSHITQKG